MKRVRVLAFLITVCMATTCLLGGTIARYQTSASIDDAATAARWGVTVSATGSLFGAKYANSTAGNNPTDSTDADEISVQSTDSVDRVAPGTKNDTGMTFTLTGTPEVDVAVSIDITAKDVFLKAGTYKDYTTGVEDDTFTATNYHPIIFTLKNGAGTTLIEGELSEIVTYLETLEGNYNANTDLSTIGAAGNHNDGTYKLTWRWDIGGNTQEDTLLGNLAVGAPYTTGVDAANYSTGVSFDITITVEQID